MVWHCGRLGDSETTAAGMGRSVCACVSVCMCACVHACMSI